MAPIKDLKKDEDLIINEIKSLKSELEELQSKYGICDPLYDFEKSDEQSAYDWLKGNGVKLGTDAEDFAS